VALDLPSEPGERGVESDGDRGADRRRARDMPDPDERGRVYEAMRALVSAETRDEPGGSYWGEAPRFLGQAADLKRRWPAERQAVPDRPGDPPESFRSGGGFYLSPERHAEAVTAIARRGEPRAGGEDHRVLPRAVGAVRAAAGRLSGRLTGRSRRSAAGGPASPHLAGHAGSGPTFTCPRTVRGQRSHVATL